MPSKNYYKNIQCQIFNKTCQALGPVDRIKRGTIWLFKCLHNGPGCEGEFESVIDNVRSGRRKSCGCHKRDDISSKIFYDSNGLPTCQALWYLGPSKDGHSEWLFRCLVNGPKCKWTFIALAKNVKLGKTQSCWCYHNLKLIERNTTHGMYGTPEYTSWQAMHDRCYNPNHSGYSNYGGKGIKVCWNWHRNNPNGFKNFLAYMGRINDPNKNTIERFDNNGDYNDEGNVHKGWVDRVV